MDIVLKKVSVECLCTLKLSIESMIHDTELQLPGLELDCQHASKYSIDFYRDVLKNKKEFLSELRLLYKQL